MKATCSHTKRCNIAALEAHCRRSIDLKHVRKELSHLNESFSYINHGLRKEESDIRKCVKEKTKRKLQSNAIPIKESVVLFDENTTIDQLKDFCQNCHEQLGLIPLKIYMHRDEGYWKDKTWIPNYHAHVVWRMYNEEGRNVRLDNKGCSKMQDIAAQSFDMVRGVPSAKKHVDAMAFRKQQEEKNLEETQKAVTEKKNEIAGLEVEKQIIENNISDLKQEEIEKKQEIENLSLIKEARKSLSYLLSSTSRAVDAATEEAKREMKRINEDRIRPLMLENTKLREEKENAVREAENARESQKRLEEEQALLKLSASKGEDAFRQMQTFHKMEKSLNEDELKKYGIGYFDTLKLMMGNEIEVDGIPDDDGTMLRFEHVGMSGKIPLKLFPSGLFAKAKGIMSKRDESQWCSISEWKTRFKRRLKELGAKISNSLKKSSGGQKMG